MSKLRGKIPTDRGPPAGDQGVNTRNGFYAQKQRPNILAWYECLAPWVKENLLPCRLVFMICLPFAECSRIVQISYLNIKVSLVADRRAHTNDITKQQWFHLFLASGVNCGSSHKWQERIYKNPSPSNDSGLRNWLLGALLTLRWTV